ncbi:MAG TPA: protein kinase [Ktedonobacteraceae bacterium]|nr:protein kinase [Ktedonobacteraceae bacterium]
MQTIGHGGMAAVYQARDTKRGTMCAIKEMSLSTVAPGEQPLAVQNFLAEARILSRLNHANLPAFTDFFTEDERRYLVMEFIDGSTLEDLLEQQGRPFSERRVLSWARQLCDVLEYLHSQQPPVIFRDMKPGNIMLSRNGRIKLIDFGIARLFRPSGGAQDTQLLGTPGFSPPEQYGGAQTDERSDIYSLAMTLFQLMTLSVSEKGFGLTDVHANFPYISPPVARALEKATLLRQEDRYESVVVFRRALLGIDTFRFENGGEATTPQELADLCARYPEEAGDYLYSGEIESWLREIGANDVARATGRIRSTVGDPALGVNKLLQAIMGPNAQTRTASASSTVTQASVPPSRGSLISRVRDPNTVVVRPRTIDFGQTYPGLTAPILLTITGAKGALVSGTIRPVESWIIIDTTTFDGLSTPVRVRADSTRLTGSSHYTGKIIIQPDDSEREIIVTVELEVLEHTTVTMPRVSGQTGSSTLQSGSQVMKSGQQGASRVRSAASSPGAQQATAARAGVAANASRANQSAPPADQPFTNARYDEYKTKYGAPGSGGWDMLKTTARQRAFMRYAITFAASLMSGALVYLLLARIPAIAHASILPPSGWFVALLAGFLVFCTLGAMLMNLGTIWANRAVLTRGGSDLATALLFLGLGEATWQNLAFPGSQLQVLVMLFLTAAGATFGIAPRVSDWIIRSSTWLMTRAVWLAFSIAAIVGAILGYGLTSGPSYGCFAPFGALGGAFIGVALVLRIRRVIRKKNASTPTP